MKKIAFTIVALLILLIVGSLTYFYVDFSLGKKRVDQFYRDFRVEKIRDLGSTDTLEILPLIDWHADRADLKGEAGVSYLIRTDESTILFDVGMNVKREDPSPLLNNMKRLGVDYEKIGVIVISHNHVDHIGGFKWARKNSFSLTNHQIDLKNKRVYTPEPMTYAGLSPVVADRPTIIAKGVATTGILPSYQFFTGRTVEQSLAINVTGKGIVLIVGCGHQTVPRLVERVGQLSEESTVGLVGGLHYPMTDSRLRVAGIPVQQVLSTGKPPWSLLTMEDVNRNIAILKRLNPEIVALSPHDSCDASLNAFRNAFPSSYREIKVGKKLAIGPGGRL